MLEPAERAFFESLAIFVGGWSLEAAEAIATPAEGAVFDLLASLMDKSLVRQIGIVDGEPRFGMLQTIQEFAMERLAARGDADRVRALYADYFIGLADIGGAELLVGDQLRWMRRFAADQDNLRATLRELLADGPRRTGGSLRLVGDAVLVGRQPIWRGHRVDAAGAGEPWPGLGRANAGEPHARHPGIRTRRPRPRAGRTGGRHARSDACRVRRKQPHGARDRGGHPGLAWDLAGGEGMVRESIAASESVADSWCAAFGHYVLGRVLLISGRATEAIAVLEASVDAVEGVTENMLSALALLVLGWAYLEVGDLAAAERSLLAALDIVRLFGNRDGTARALEALAAVATAGGVRRRARNCSAPPAWRAPRLASRCGCRTTTATSGRSAHSSNPGRRRVCTAHARRRGAGDRARARAVGGPSAAPSRHRERGEACSRKARTRTSCAIRSARPDDHRRAPGRGEGLVPLYRATI